MDWPTSVTLTTLASIATAAILKILDAFKARRKAAGNGSGAGDSSSASGSHPVVDADVADLRTRVGVCEVRQENTDEAVRKLERTVERGTEEIKRQIRQVDRSRQSDVERFEGKIDRLSDLIQRRHDPGD